VGLEHSQLGPTQSNNTNKSARSLQVSWTVAIESCAEPVQFSMDMAVTMQTRDARPPSRLVALLSSTRILSKTSTVFRVRLSPPLTRSPKDLWRLDTSEKYVRGEDVLGGWRPRGIAVVEDHTKLVEMERRAADVQAVRVILATLPWPPNHHRQTLLFGVRRGSF